MYVVVVVVVTDIRQRIPRQQHPSPQCMKKGQGLTSDSHGYHQEGQQSVTQQYQGATG